jgi:6-phosphofructokinase 1
MIVQGGGPTAVFNNTLAEIISEAQQQNRIGRIFGARFGVEGLVDGDIVDLSDLASKQLQTLRRTPGAALGSSRHSPSEVETLKLLEILRRFDIHNLLFLGGNGTMRGAQIVADLCRSGGLSVQVVGVPKTIDNDIAATDRAPGYGSAARYIAASTRELAADIYSLRQPVSIVESLGRNVGWIAAASALAKTTGAIAPHLVYIPEVPFELDAFLSDLDRAVSKLGWALVVVAEGIRNHDGSPVFQTADPSQSDPLKRPLIGGVAPHLATLVGQHLKIRCRNEKPGLLGRASMAYASAQDLADAALVGRAGVLALVSGETDVMIALSPLSESNQARTRLVPLTDAAGHERAIPAAWLQGGPIPVNNLFLDYLRPLVGPLDEHITDIGIAVSQTEVTSK